VNQLLAETDRLDAAAIALSAEGLRPEPRPLLDAAVQALTDLAARRLPDFPARRPE
jgi:hypothetical protein